MMALVRQGTACATALEMGVGGCPSSVPSDDNIVMIMAVVLVMARSEGSASTSQHALRFLNLSNNLRRYPCAQPDQRLWIPWVLTSPSPLPPPVSPGPSTFHFRSWGQTPIRTPGRSQVAQGRTQPDSPIPTVVTALPRQASQPAPPPNPMAKINAPFHNHINTDM